MIEKRTERLQLRLSKKTLKRLRLLAASNGESMASYLEMLINTDWHEISWFFGLYDD